LFEQLSGQPCRLAHDLAPLPGIFVFGFCLQLMYYLSSVLRLENVFYSDVKHLSTLSTAMSRPLLKYGHTALLFEQLRVQFFRFALAPPPGIVVFGFCLRHMYYLLSVLRLDDFEVECLIHHLRKIEILA
jgi:hypothetical protein